VPDTGLNSAFSSVNMTLLMKNVQKFTA